MSVNEFVGVVSIAGVAAVSVAGIAHMVQTRRRRRRRAESEAEAERKRSRPDEDRDEDDEREFEDLSPESVAGLRVADLRDVLKARGLSSSGTKRVLAERLLASLQADVQEMEDDEAEVEDDDVESVEVEDEDDDDAIEDGGREDDFPGVVVVKTRGAARAVSIDHPRLSGSTSAAVHKEWVVQRRIGTEGKDGMLFLVRRQRDGVMGAMKVFKSKKSVANITREMQLQRRAAAAGLAPRILSEWAVSRSNLCFVMQLMDSTLADVLEAQGGEMSSAQVRRCHALYNGLSDQGILHNDPNVTNNIMADTTGRLFLIDFGMSREIKTADRKRYGPNPNMRTLASLDQKVRGTPFRTLTKPYEQEHGVVVDLYARQREQVQDRLKAKGVAPKRR